MDGMNAVPRVFATLFIWTAVTFMGIATLENSQFLAGGPVIVIMILLVAAAGTTTQSIWKNSDSASSEAEKNKRRGKVDKLLDKLSDSELDDLRARLTGESDGEVSLDELLAERNSRRS